MTYRILHLITHLGIGGAQDYMLHAARNLDRSRFEIHVAAGTDELDWLQRAREWSDELHLVHHLRHAVMPREDARALGELVHLLRKGHYDLIHTHSSKAGALGRLAAFIAGVPVVVHTVHGFSWNDYMAPHTRRLYQGIEYLSARYSDQILAVCESNARDLVRQHIVPAHKITTIYNGIDAAHLDVTIDRQGKCAELGLDPQRPIVGMVGRLCTQKAPLDFVSAARLVLQQMPQVQFVVVGDGPMRAEVEAATADLPQVHMLGARSDIAALLQTFDVFASASLWEGLSRAVAEAMLVKLPVAATDVNGTPELVINGVTGLLSGAQRPDLLAENILKLIAHPELAHRLADQGYEHVQHLCSVSTMVQRLDTLYRDLLVRREGQRMLQGSFMRKYPFVSRGIKR